MPTRRVSVLLAAVVLAVGSTHALRGGAQPASMADWRLIVLGIVQDAGMPHLKCQQAICVEARAGRRPAEKVASLGLVDRTTGQAYLFDATPDLPAQIHALTGGPDPDGIFLTHAHIGHYTGLMYLGKESVAARAVPTYVSARMAGFLTGNGPWSLLVADGHLALRPLRPDEPVRLPGGLEVTPFVVPHRDEFTDTLGFRIAGPRRSALFIPDIDRWETWDRDIRALADTVDLAFLDGTFQSADEVRGRSIEDIPHPLMTRTRDLLEGARARVWFVHLNHSNPALRGAEDVALEGMEFEM